MNNSIDIDNFINEVYEYVDEDKKIVIDNSNGDKITIEIDKENNNIDTNTIVYYSFLTLIAIVILCFLIGLSFKKNKEE